MKRIVFGVAVAMLATGVARADVFDYAELSGGVTVEPNLTFGCCSYGMDTGYNVGGALGWNVWPSVSLGMDMLFTHAGYSTYSSSLESFSVMANGEYHFDVDGPLKPFVGVGIGAVQVSYNSSGVNGSDWRFGYQGEVGASIALQNGTSVVVEYRYQGAQDSTIDGIPNIEYKSHNLSVGLHFDL